MLFSRGMGDSRSQTVLDRIVADKRLEVERLRARRSLAEIERAAAAAGPVRDFLAAFSAPPPAGIHLLAEIKLASPSAGDICSGADVPAVACVYERCGAAAISVLTDARHFKGSLDHMIAARRAARLPVLRKEFIIDAWQVYESRAAGADAILLMTQILDDDQLGSLLALAHRLGMAALVEGHDEADIRRAVACGARLVGINNRDLRTFQVDLQTTCRLAPLVPVGRIAVSQSAIKARADVLAVQRCGARAIQVGETLMRSGTRPGGPMDLAAVAAKIRELLGTAPA